MEITESYIDLTVNWKTYFEEGWDVMKVTLEDWFKQCEILGGGMKTS